MTERTPFVLLAAERTGSNLLSGLLDSHPEIFAAGEIFNPRQIKKGEIAWPGLRSGELDELLSLREARPVQFLERLMARGGGSRGKAPIVGFKLMYYHADLQPDVVESLVANRELRVVHLTRRNLLERYLSNRKAELSGEWQRRARDAGKPKAPLPRFEVDLADLVRNFVKMRAWETGYRERFKGHRVLEVEYEDLAADPVAVGARVADFLGAAPGARLEVQYAKTGGQHPSELVSNWEELRAQFAAWAEFFAD